MQPFDVFACSERIRPWAIKTPLVEVETLSELTGKRIFLKLENMQRTGAFKFRGAMNYMLTLDPALAKKGVVTASSGNHGLGMSLAGKLQGIKCTVVMPVTALQIKQEKAKQYGAQLILAGSDYDEAQEYAANLAEQEGYNYVPSFNHRAIIEGQGTIYQEIIAELPQTDMVITPVGGGGLLAGLLVAREQLQSPAQVMGIEPEGADGMYQSLEAGRVVTISDMQTIADGVAVRTPGSLNLDIIQSFNPLMARVSDAEILKAQKLLLRNSKLIVEVSAAVSVAGLLAAQLPERIKTVVCVITGANLDLASLKDLLE